MKDRKMDQEAQKIKKVGRSEDIAAIATILSRSTRSCDLSSRLSLVHCSVILTSAFVLTGEVVRLPHFRIHSSNVLDELHILIHQYSLNTRYTTRYFTFFVVHEVNHYLLQGGPYFPTSNRTLAIHCTNVICN